MGTIGGHGNGFFRRRKNSKKIGFSKCRSDHFRGPNRRILGQGIGQNLNRTIFEKVEKTVFFQLFRKNAKKSSFFDGFLYSKLPINRPWRPTSLRELVENSRHPKTLAREREGLICGS